MKNIFSGISNYLQTSSLFCLLIPTFFVLKNADLYYGAVPAGQIFWLTLKYLAASVICYFLLSTFFVKTRFKAGLYLLVILVLYFFYNSFNHFLQDQKWLYPFYEYKWSLPVLLVVLSLIFLIIHKLKNLPRKAFLFINSLLILFCFFEWVALAIHWITPHEEMLGLRNEMNISNPTVSVKGKHPNIYFLIFDEYQGNKGLKKIFDFENLSLRNKLATQGFFSPNSANSNYNFTFFSMPSIFNMSYLQGNIQGRTREENVLHFEQGIELIKNSELIVFLKKAGYSIMNLSPFKLDDTTGAVSQFESVLSEKQLIERQTLYNTIKEKAGIFISNKKVLKWINPTDYNNQFYNEFVRGQLISVSRTLHANPLFTYAHFFMPHVPFLKDSNGVDINFKELTIKTWQKDSAYLNDHYLRYLKYANSIMVATIDTLMQNDPGAMVLIMSDHGYRGFISPENDLQFDIQFYLKTPDQNYSGWPDTVNAVNVFRILLNKEFNQSLNYLKDQRTGFNAN